MRNFYFNVSFCIVVILLLSLNLSEIQAKKKSSKKSKEKENKVDLDLTKKDKKKDQAQMRLEYGEAQVAPGCLEELPNLSVGDYNLTQKNYESFKKGKKLFVVGVSDKNCLQCCNSEYLLNEMQQVFANMTYTHKGKRIQVARADVASKAAFLDKESLRTDINPSIFVYLNGYYYMYEGNKTSLTEFLHFMNKIIYPVLELESEDDLLKFLELKNEPRELTKFFSKQKSPLGSIYTTKKAKTRVVAFISDKDDYKQELKYLQHAARYSVKREELRIGVVYDNKIIKKYKNKYGNLWFPGGSLTSLILKRYDE